jgi:KTSC domain
MPEMAFVDSSGIEAVGYDYGTQELYVRFLKSGETYIYYDVEEWVFQEFMQTDSKSRYLNSAIKGRYQYSKLSSIPRVMSLPAGMSRRPPSRCPDGLNSIRALAGRDPID